MRLDDGREYDWMKLGAVYASGVRAVNRNSIVFVKRDSGL